MNIEYIRREKPFHKQHKAARTETERKYIEGSIGFQIERCEIAWCDLKTELKNVWKAIKK